MFTTSDTTLQALLSTLTTEKRILLSPEQEQYIVEYVNTLDDEQRQARILSADIAVREINLNQTALTAILLTDAPEEQIVSLFDQQVMTIIQGLHRVSDLYRKEHISLETENFRKLLLSLAEDVRVVLIIIAERVALMRRLNMMQSMEEESPYRMEVARETSFLYAPLAHRLGLYTLKTELEDLSLKFLHYDTYKSIAKALNEKKDQREAYIKAFIGPVEQKLMALGLRFHIKGRTKSIHSIYNKMQKQNCGVDGIYDLFAIRVILDSPLEREKAECWQAYSVVADMYQPNPKRLRDWLSIPKSNGYESLHTTVLGPEGKWVEVQIRTERMDEVAEKGVAAHWKYKGGKSEQGMDEFLKGVREMLESADVDAKEALDDFRLRIYDEEVFVFTPNGDLHKLPKGATILDFAFSIHSALGCKCVGGKINGRNVPIKYVLKNGDQIEILTSPTQKPNEAWLKLVCTTKARNKIRQSLKEQQFKDAAEGREMLERRFKNWKIELEEGNVSKLAKKLNFKAVSDFHQALAQGKLDMLSVRDLYLKLLEPEATAEIEQRRIDNSAENFVQQRSNSDELVIQEDLKNVDFKLAKCCNPIFGDPIFGFVSVTQGIKVHRMDCPNAADMQERFAYRIVPARWSGKAQGQQYPITLRVLGHDDIGIVAGITSIISKESGVLLRTISIDSHDGVFEGHLTLLVSDTSQLEGIQKKIMTVKGVKQVSRS